MLNETIYVSGHRHPDSDAICSAIAYANLLNETGKTALACRQGPLNEETKFILKRFGLDNPLLMTDARARLCDIELDIPTTIKTYETVHHAWHLMENTQNRSLFVINDEGKLKGICTTSDLSRFRFHPETDLEQLMKTASLANISRTIGGRIRFEPEHFSFNGQVHVITVDQMADSPYEVRDCVVMMSVGSMRQIDAIREGAKCLVLTMGACATLEVMSEAKRLGCAIIETPESTMHTAAVINESYSVEQIMSCNPITFLDTEYVDDVASKMNHSRVRSYPVLNENGDIVGGVSRYHTRNYRKLQIALVDHSAKNQSMQNIDKGDIVAIIDHHHIGDITTSHPIEYRNHRCGCTCTIVNLLYKEAGLVPSKPMAGIMMSAILSDTLNFKSATTTQEDRDTVQFLAEIAGIKDVNAYAVEMLAASVALKDSTPKDILYRDLKFYDVDRYHIAIGQTNFSHTEEVQSLLPKMKEQVFKEQERQGLDLLVMLFTDVLGNGSYFVYGGSMSYVLQELLETIIDDHSGFDPNIISRKQQLMPKLSELLKQQ